MTHAPGLGSMHPHSRLPAAVGPFRCSGRRLADIYLWPPSDLGPGGVHVHWFLRHLLVDVPQDLVKRLVHVGGIQSRRFEEGEPFFAAQRLHDHDQRCDIVSVKDTLRQSHSRAQHLGGHLAMRVHSHQVDC